MSVSPAPQPEVLELADVQVSLAATEVLRGVSAGLLAGEAVALMGPNGSGKSTLVRAVLGLVPHRGRITLFGTPQQRFRDWSKIGYVPQRSAPSLQSATVREVVASGRLAHRRPFLPARAEDRRMVEQSIDRVGLTTLAGVELGALSGGQQQRALIARALAGDPALMVLDEPMTGVDLDTQEELTEVLAGLKNHGMAMLVVLHDLGPLDRLMDRAWVLRDGRLVHDGAPRAAGHDHHDAHCADQDVVVEISLVAGTVERQWER